MADLPETTGEERLRMLGEALQAADYATKKDVVRYLDDMAADVSFPMSNAETGTDLIGTFAALVDWHADNEKQNEGVES